MDALEPGRAGDEPSLHVLLGIPEDAGMTVVDRSYEQRRRDLLEADPDWLRDEVRVLDAAYRRYLDVWQSRRTQNRRAVPNRSDIEAQEARKKARRDKAAARHAAQRDLRAELAAQGWPQPWPVALCGGWQRRGGTLETAQAVDRAGWGRGDVQSLIDLCEDLSGVTVPDGTAREHQRFGDTLAALVAGLWPPVPPGTVLSVKALWRDGRRERFIIIDQPASRTLRTFAQVQDCWASTDTSLVPDVPLAQVVADHPDLFTVPAGRSVEAWIDPGLLGDTLSRDLVSFPGDEVEQAQLWPEDTGQEWADADEELEQAYPGLPWGHRWARVNGDRVSALRPEPPTGTLLPVPIDESSFEFLEARSLARSTWFSEGTGPVSWNGGAELVDLGNGLLLDRTWGDHMDDPPSVGPLLAEPDALAVRIADWVADQQLGPLAALALEQYDPAGTLSPPDRARWDRALSEITEFGWCDFDADDEVLDVVRGLLAHQDDAYQRAAAGLADPTGPQGRALLGALEDAIRGAATGTLLWGDW